MKHLMKKFGIFLLNLCKPLFTRWMERKGNFHRKLRETFTDPYLSGMITRFSVLHDSIFKPSFDKVRTDPAEIASLKKLIEKGTLIYVMKNRGQLEYSFFNHLFLKEGIPLARFANGSRTLFWRPLKEICAALLYRLDLYYSEGLLQDPIQSGILEKRILQGESALLNLKVSREFIFGASEDPLEFIPPLVRAAQKSVKPVFLITQQFLYDRRPEKAKKSWADFFFGEKSSPGPIRKIILFFLSYQKKATVKFGDPLDLKEFLAEQKEVAPQDLALRLKNLLLSRLMIERKSITGPVLKPREAFLEKILQNPGFRESLAALGQKTGKALPVLQKEAAAYFDEMAARVNYSYIDLYDLLINWMFTHIYEGLEIDALGLSRIKSVAGKNPVVLVPSHKSHIDYLLLSYVFYNNDLTLPHVCAGINLKFWPAGHFVRRGGGFFIRRTIRGNDLYKLVLKQYLQALLKDGYSIEFFIEGTRSRTGKLLKPKMGILSMLVDGYLEGAAEDITFVPISINYERIIEAKSHADEIHGASKEKENVSGIIRARKSLGQKYGKVFIRFAEPISLKSFLDEKGIKPHNQTVEACRDAIGEFAYLITYNINKAALVTSTSLVAMALLSCPRKGIPEAEILRRTRHLKRYLEFKGANLSALLGQKEHWAMQEALQKLVSERTIGVHHDFRERFYTIDQEKRIALDCRKNNAVHFFVSLVCFSKIAAQAKKTTLTLSEVEKQYETLKTLLRHDFTFSERAPLREHLLKVVSFYEGEKILTWNAAEETITLIRPDTNAAFELYASLLDNFFESYILTLLYVKHIPFEKIDSKKLVPLILEKGKALYLKGDLKHPEALSRFNIENALNVFRDVGLIKVEKNGLLTGVKAQRAAEGKAPSPRSGVEGATRAPVIDRWEEILEALLGIGESSPDYFTETPSNTMVHQSPSQTNLH